jgi:hypothetical protein
MNVIVLNLRIGLTLAALAAGTILCAQEGKKVTSHDGSCQVTVPADWQVSGSFGIANSPDKTIDVAVSTPMRTPTLDDLKQTAAMVYAGDKVTKSTASEFQMEGQGLNGKPNVYRGIQLTGKVCIVEVTYGSGTVEDARKIAGSLKAAK